MSHNLCRHNLWGELGIVDLQMPVWVQEGSSRIHLVPPVCLYQESS
jgi:hypothetical protein